MNRKPVERRSIGLGKDAIRSRLATTRPENRNDIGHIWREQDRLARETCKMRSKNPSFIEQGIRIFTQSFQKLTSLTEVFVTKHLKTKRLPSKKTRAFSVLLALFVLSSLLFFVLNGSRTKNDQPGALGAQSTDNTQTDDRRTEEQPDFKVLYPKNNESLTAVTRRAPSGDLIHTYRDSINETEIEVTQQKVPVSFTGNELKELEKLAKNFLADNIIQVDSITVHHGRDEKTDVQSLFFIKDQSLVSIRSAQKLSDDLWVAYVLNLQ